MISKDMFYLTALNRILEQFWPFLTLLGTTSLDRRPTTILISEVDVDIKDAVLAHMSKFGEVVDPVVVVSFWPRFHVAALGFFFFSISIWTDLYTTFLSGL